jgi:hypothetical protein
MKKTSIKTHLRKYSIFKKRSTTINHAFASAMAPYDDYKEELVDKILSDIECLNDGSIICVYCGKRLAETWDHLHALVKNNEPSGYGHKYGNLVPSCNACNSKKGNKDWQTANDMINGNDPDQHAKVIRVISRYITTYPANGLEIEPHIKQSLDKIKAEILQLMKQADKILNGNSA